MEPSSLIFVALAVAWAVYLGPKLFAHHDEGLRSRTVSTFSRSMRVLARREAGPKGTDLVRPRKGAAPTAQEAREQQYVEAPVRLTATQMEARRRAAKRATKRRRNVLGVLVAVLVAVAVAVVVGMVDRVWVAAPVALLLAWLIACRLMVKRERSVRTVRVPAVPEGEPAPAYQIDEETGEIVAVFDEPEVEESVAEALHESAAGRWDPVQPPLPTYVSKPAAPRRTVRTIDLDSTGVWSSGRNASDSALAREAEQAERSAKRAAGADRRATGS